MTRCIEEHDAPAVRRDVIRADMLRDAARLALGDARFANRIEKRRLPVVDVAHDGDDRRARHDVFRLHVFGFHFEHVFFERA